MGDLVWPWLGRHGKMELTSLSASLLITRQCWPQGRREMWCFTPAWICDRELWYTCNLFFRLNTWFKVLTYSLKELGFSTLKIFFHQTIAFDIHCHSQKPPGTAAAAKSLQSCLTLCDPRDGSPPGTANQRQTF